MLGMGRPVWWPTLVVVSPPCLAAAYVIVRDAPKLLYGRVADWESSSQGSTKAENS